MRPRRRTTSWRSDAVLEELHIRGLGVIEDAVLALGPGLTVVTGETGAGKTMVVTGLMLLFGGRADSARVRAGAEQASVDGRLELGPGSDVAERVRDAGGELDEDTGLVLRRVVTAAGRSRAYVGGAAAPVSVLGELAERLLTVHGQADQLLLTRPAQQRGALDRFADLDLSEFRESYQRWREADAALRERTAHAAELRRESDLLTHGLAEIEAAAPQPGEDVELGALAGRLAHSDALRLASGQAHDALLGRADAPMADAADVSGLLGPVSRALGQVAGADAELDALTVRLADLSSLAMDLGAEFGSYAEQLDADPIRLEQIEVRRAVLGALVRKYGEGLDADVTSVLEWSERAAKRLAETDVSDEALAALAGERAAAARRTAQLVRAVTAARRSAAEQLGRAVTTELAGLAMGSAMLSIQVRARPASVGAAVLEIDGTQVGIGPEGADEVEFCLRAHPEAPELPLARGGSGGELSRVMLAIEVCLAGGDPVPTMVFDEVDAGVGGRAAGEVGRRLARLARDRQVIVVTHLAQVAAFADRQVVVDKPAQHDGRVVASDVRVVVGPARVAELARMLGGTDSGAAREHAAELLSSAAAESPALAAAEGTAPPGTKRPRRRAKAVKSPA
ncbi:MAG: DNA repair protein RecN [Jatrophihabitantaceae bacterium]